MSARRSGPTDAELRRLAERFTTTPEDAERLARSTRRRLEWRLARSGRECRRCGRTLPLREFGRDLRNMDGLHNECRACRSARRTE